MLAAEFTKKRLGKGESLNNSFDHDLYHRPKNERHCFRRRLPHCIGCMPSSR
jgi:hypothetical protein